MTLEEFLLARIAEDEAVAKLYAEGNHPMYIYDDGHLGWPDGEWDDGTPYLLNRHTGYAVAYDPARVLAECAAKRAIVSKCLDWPGKHEGWRKLPWYGAGNDILFALAAVYKDHPDHQEEWAL